MKQQLQLSILTLITPLLIGLGCIIETESEVFDETDTSGSCEIGSEGCPCTSGGKCNDPFSCNENLNLCIADTCPVGTETCACTPMGACDEGLMCASEVCVDAGCSTGTETCPCTSGGGCDPGLECLSGLCVDASGEQTEEGSTGSSTGTVDETGGGSGMSQETTTGGRSGDSGSTG